MGFPGFEQLIKPLFFKTNTGIEVFIRVKIPFESLEEGLMPRVKTANSWRFRSAEKDDEPFLWDMLYETLLSEEDAEKITRESLADPSVSKYVEAWGGIDDLGIIAMDEDSRPLGAAWSRLLTGPNEGFGYTDDQTPEIAIAVVPGERGRGLGTELLRRLIREARKRYPGVSLSVAPSNPAQALYRRLGFRIVEIRDEHPVMILEFDK